MTYWLPFLLALVLVAVEVRRLLVGHWRREWRRALLARAVVLTVGAPAVFQFNVGAVVSMVEKVGGISGQLLIACGHPHGTGVVVKIDYARGKLWVADV